MNEPSDFGIGERLTGFLTGTLSLAEFREWFAHALWDIERSGSDDEIELAYLIKNRLAESSSGYVTEDQLKETFRPLVDRELAPAGGRVSRPSA